MRTVLSEIRRLRERMDAIPDTRERAAPEHPAVASVRAFLEANEFSDPYIDRIVARIGTELPLERLSDTEALERIVVEWIRDSILVRTVGETSCRRILVVVGPTGVGKTTTIAKLAAIHSVGIGGEERVPVHMITIDNYRIGARQQIETYGDIIGVPVTGVESVEELQRVLALCPDSGMILVDTIGKSPSDRERIGEMNRLLAACGPDAEVHIAVSASMKTSDMERTLDAFAVFGYKAAILTKTDETACLGSALSALAAKKTPLSYITTGQRVPQDIEKARADRIVRRIVRPERGERPGRTVSISGGNAP